MSCLVRSFNKATGVCYVYESTSYRDPSSKKPRSHRRCIGKIDPSTGLIVPTGKRGRQKKQTLPDADSAAEIVPDNAESSKLVEKIEQLHEEQARNKELDSEVRQLKYQMKQIESLAQSVSETLNKILTICQ